MQSTSFSSTSSPSTPCSMISGMPATGVLMAGSPAPERFEQHRRKRILVAVVADSAGGSHDVGSPQPVGDLRAVGRLNR